MRPLAIGLPGELYIGGAGLARGYLDSRRTAERFLPDPASPGVSPGERLYRSGDRGRLLPDGRLELLGRWDRQVKIRGARIDPGEIEGWLERQQSVAQAVVEARPEPGIGLRLVAYLAGPGPGEGGARRHRRRAAAFPERPPAGGHGALSVRLAGFPAAGRRAARSTAARCRRPRVPEAGAPAAGTAFRPLDAVTRGLLEIWLEVLAVADAGIHDNFCELGGHSLLATRVVSRIERFFGVELPLRTAFESPTVAAMTAVLESDLRAEDPPEASSLRPAPEEARATAALSFAQQRLWFLDRLEPGSEAYNVSSAYRLAGALDPAALEAALGEIVRRHQVLRTRFPSTGGRPVPSIAERRNPSLAAVDLRRLAARGPHQVKRILRADSLQPFDLETGPFPSCASASASTSSP